MWQSRDRVLCVVQEMPAVHSQVTMQYIMSALPDMMHTLEILNLATLLATPHVRLVLLLFARWQQLIEDCVVAVSRPLC